LDLLRDVQTAFLQRALFIDEASILAEVESPIDKRDKIPLDDSPSSTGPESRPPGVDN
jgi:hypothetical protein